MRRSYDIYNGKINLMLEHMIKHRFFMQKERRGSCAARSKVVNERSSSRTGRKDRRRARELGWEEGKKEESSYIAKPEYQEECTFIVAVEMLERLPKLKIRIKKYLEAFPE